MDQISLYQLPPAINNNSRHIIMGLIRKQAGLDLQAKISTWLNTCERFKATLWWGYANITPDNTIKVDNLYRSFVMEQIIHCGELPDYIMFDFTDCDPVKNPHIMMDITEVIEQLNKARNNIIGIDRCTIYTGEWVSHDLRKDAFGIWRIVLPRLSK